MTPPLSRPGPFVLIAALLLSCSGPAPHIETIHPRIGRMGEILAIEGANFGAERGESWITIAGTSPTASSYVSWSDGLVLVRVPEFGESGLVYVHRGGKKSNAALFSNADAIPVPWSGGQYDPAPRIASIDPSSAPPGSVISIAGSNFGAIQEGGQVVFTWGAAQGEETAWIAVQEDDFGYESWNDREIRVRVPSGAISGNIEVRTARGASRPEFFEVNGRPGTRQWQDKRSYAVFWSVDIKVAEAANPNTLYLWVPRLSDSPSQHPARAIQRNAEPFIESYRGSSLYKFSDLPQGSAFRLDSSWLVEVYAMECQVNPQMIKNVGSGQLESIYTRSDPLVPSDDPGIRALAASITGREQNHWQKAKLLYAWILKEISFSEEGTRSGGIAETLLAREADAWQAALLFCALARASGIPALPVSGVLVTRDRKTVRHFWAEFWIRGFGWVPVDPALGAGAAPEGFQAHEDARAWYFGGIDNQHIAFSRGYARRSRQESRGRTASRERDYSLQSIWEEAAGGIESYSSLWPDVEITGVYMQ